MHKKYARDHIRRVAGTVTHYNDDRDGITHATEYLIDALDLDVEPEWTIPQKLAADDMLDLPDGAIVLDRHGNPYRMEDGQLGHFITMGLFPFTLIYLPRDES